MDSPGSRWPSRVPGLDHTLTLDGDSSVTDSTAVGCMGSRQHRSPFSEASAEGGYTVTGDRGEFGAGDCRCERGRKEACRLHGDIGIGTRRDQCRCRILRWRPFDPGHAVRNLLCGPGPALNGANVAGVGGPWISTTGHRLLRGEPNRPSLDAPHDCNARRRSVRK